jgi:poly(hydroxyalkanoate) synthase III subunit E
VGTLDTQVQAALAAHWGEIARTAAQRFIARAAGAPGALGFEQSLKLYELWVSCAEEAYAASARTEEFARLQSELANVSAALLVEQRRHAEGLVRAFGLPTRAEVDALYDQLKELRQRVAQGAASRAAPRSRAPRKSARAGKQRRGRRA